MAWYEFRECHCLQHPRLLLRPDPNQRGVVRRPQEGGQGPATWGKEKHSLHRVNLKGSLVLNHILVSSLGHLDYYFLSEREGLQAQLL